MLFTKKIKKISGCLWNKIYETAPAEDYSGGYYPYGTKICNLSQAIEWEIIFLAGTRATQQKKI